MEVPESTPSILFIDAYDSFSNNIISLLRTSLHCSVRVLKIDTLDFPTDELLTAELRSYDAVICGPGPGHPANERDVGLMRRIWRLPDEHILPTLGICLGFQSLGLEFGATVKRLNQGLHGMVRRVRHIGEQRNVSVEKSIFDGVGDVHATLYQSLCADIGQDSVSEDEWPAIKWHPASVAPVLKPLAWVEDNDANALDQRILVALKHIQKPFWGLQYHPESICTNQESTKVIVNWFRAAQEWNKEHHRLQTTTSKRNRDELESVKAERPTKMSLLGQARLAKASGHAHNGVNGIKLNGSAKNGVPWYEKFGTGFEYRCQTVDFSPHVSVPDIVELLEQEGTDILLLDSSNYHITGPGSEQVRGRYSIIGLNVDQTLRVEYRAADNHAQIYQASGHGAYSRVSLYSIGGIWPFLAEFLDHRRITDGNVESPFWGGFVGYTTYELGLESIEIPRDPCSNVPPRLDLNFAWVTESIVVDHLLKKIYVQALIDPNEGFAKLDETTQKLRRSLVPQVNGNAPSSHKLSNGAVPDINEVIASKVFKVKLPTHESYEDKVTQCQEFIRSGDSYELCLTDQSQITLPHSSATAEESTLNTPSWSLYKTLRQRQPAPFSSFLRLGSATFVSCSPERFLKWDAQGTCELRPMKGTVKKSAEVSTLADAEAKLQVPKERAENLMIVDLVRHDLHSVCGAGNVDVPRLMVVEEYASVFQMVTVVKGQIPEVDEDDPAAEATEPSSEHQALESLRRNKHTGIDVLSASLPPGSMTGAPKKRACELLREIEENQDRSLYSGVVGYMDVGGRGDFSVSIRCLFRWDDESDTEKGIETWHVGAGGAVTALSTPVGEREEMETKLSGTLGVFGVSVGGGANGMRK